MNLEEFGPDAKDEMSPADYIQYCLDQYYEYRTLAMDPTNNDQATKLYSEKASDYYARAQEAMDEIEPDMLHVGNFIFVDGSTINGPDSNWDVGDYMVLEITHMDGRVVKFITRIDITVYSFCSKITFTPFCLLKELSFAIKSQYPSFFQEGSNLYFNSPNLFSNRE